MKNKTLRDDFNFASTFRHPLAARGAIEMVPTQWVMKLANPAATDRTDLTPGSPELVDMQTLWRNMKEKGMRDPFILSAGRHSRDCRLEAGNHRIRLFAENGVDFVPATVLVADDCLIHEGNGPHRFRRALLIPKQDFSHHGYDDREYKAPSEVFAALARMKSMGRLPVCAP